MIVQMVLAAIVSLFVLAAAQIRRPSSAKCPPGWTIANGIRRSGEFSCSVRPPASCGEPKGPYEGVPCPPLPVIQGQIWCDGKQPIVVDHERVACASY